VDEGGDDCEFDAKGGVEWEDERLEGGEGIGGREVSGEEGEFGVGEVGAVEGVGGGGARAIGRAGDGIRLYTAVYALSIKCVYSMR